MGFRNVKEIAAAYDEGRWHHQRVFRSTSQYANTGLWTDSSMSGGSPKYNAYVGAQLEATPLIGGGNNGIHTGPAPGAGMTKHIAKVAANTMSTTMPIQSYMLCDYLMFYPLIDGDSTDLQEFIQSATLPRYQSGEGVYGTLVITGGAAYQYAQATVSYTNSDGVAGRTTTFRVYNLSTSNLPIINGVAGTGGYVPFFPLAAGDKGIRSVESIQFDAGTGMLFALVLMKPLVSAQALESATVSEIDMTNQRMSLPKVESGAYLNFIWFSSAAASTSLPFHAGIDFIWG